MSLKIGSGFKLQAKAFLDEREYFKTLEEMRSFDERALPSGFDCYCEETQKQYRYRDTNSINEDTGKWREINEKGDKGDTGASAYEDAVRLGFKGTIEDYSIAPVENEEKRKEEETKRNASESKRVSAEAKRVIDCNNLISDVTAKTTTAINNANSATTLANNAAQAITNAEINVINSVDAEGLNANWLIIPNKFDTNIGTGDFTIVVTFRYNEFVSNYSTNMLFNFNSSNLSRLTYNRSAKRFYFDDANDGVWDNCSIEYNLSNGGVATVAVTRKGNTYTIYADGIKGGELIKEPSVFNINSVCLSVANESYFGDVDYFQFRTFNYALTSEEVSKLYNNGRVMDVKIGDEHRYLITDEFLPSSLTSTKWLNTGVNKGNDITLTNPIFTYDPPYRDVELIEGAPTSEPIAAGLMRVDTKNKRVFISV